MGSHSALSLSRGDMSSLQEMRFTQEPATAPPLPDLRAGRLELPVEELNFCHLKTPAQIARISHLRNEIQLPEAVVTDPGFHGREKKETSRGSSRLSATGARSLEPFASSRWIGDSPLARPFSSASRSCRPISTRRAGK